MTADFRTAPVDAASAAALADDKLRYELVDTKDPVAFRHWLSAVGRGFHDPAGDADSAELRRFAYLERRAVGVWDDTLSDAPTPVGTLGSWVTDLTVAGEASIPAWAISAVTVAPTHRRRGIARSLMEGELRTAKALGIPAAILTASEATIYERWGFSPAAMMAEWEIDVARAKWSGAIPGGRVQLVTTEQLRDHDGPAILERARLAVPGQIRFWGILWDRLFGLPSDDAAKSARCVRYDDEHGTPQGFAIYRPDRGEAEGKLSLGYLIGATDDAYSALWRYLLQVDLITTITASLRPVDEPFRWQVADFRAVKKTWESDHLWLRILDPRAVLEARRYSAPGRFRLTVTDPLGFATGDYLLEVDADGVGLVSDGDAPDAAGVALSVNELAAISLGAVSATTLAKAGRILEQTPSAAVAVDRAFASPVAPWLSIWF
ncbi:GNAT family N-acetyltransferase [Cryobacterium sp. BB736]|uniref:GNAT family N-acetyltransferase n=1 Tax=Cryobacterium sp. BB736 TaxID=2746963 RepID=UPI001875384F